MSQYVPVKCLTETVACSSDNSTDTDSVDADNSKHCYSRLSASSNVHVCSRPPCYVPEHGVNASSTLHINDPLQRQRHRKTAHRTEIGLVV